MPKNANVALHAVTNEPPPLPASALTSADLEKQLVELERELRDVVMLADPSEADRVAGEVERCRIKLRAVQLNEADAAKRAEEERIAAEQAERDRAACEAFDANDFRPELEEVLARAKRVADDLRFLTEAAPRIVSKSNQGRMRVAESRGQLRDGRGFFSWNRAHDQLPIGCVAQAGTALPAVSQVDDVVRWVHTAWLEGELRAKGISLQAFANDQSGVLQRIGLPDAAQQWIPSRYRRP